VQKAVTDQTALVHSEEGALTAAQQAVVAATKTQADVPNEIVALRAAVKGMAAKTVADQAALDQAIAALNQTSAAVVKWKAAQVTSPRSASDSAGQEIVFPHPTGRCCQLTILSAII